jgi:NAD-dependent dihydropyrimidine dehydrogenase PreA subunit
VQQGLWSRALRSFDRSGADPGLTTVRSMTYVIGKGCVDVADKSCVQECPVDCIYEGARTMYINPNECVDCGACKSICRVGAIYWEGDLPDDELGHLADNAAFFDQPLPGRERPLGCPGGATRFGRLGVDTPLIAAIPLSVGKSAH